MASGPIPAFIGVLSVLTGLVPIPVAEAVVLVFVSRQALGLARGLRAVRSGQGTFRGVLGRGALRLGQDVGILVALFYVLWGFQYARPGLDAHLGLEATGSAGVDELYPLAERAVAETNRAYLELHGSDDIGQPTPAARLAQLAPGVAEGWERIAPPLDLPRSVLGSRGRPKAFLSTPLIKRLGIAGMYFPYTGEALVLSDLPGVIQGKDIGHEMAHQRGFASETDANTLGALVAARSPDPLARYSALFFIERQLSDALRRVDAEGALELSRRRLPGVARDLQDLYAYWRPAQTQVGRVASRVNDTMLRSHGVSDGVESYRGSTWVFLALARERGAEFLFGRPAAE